MKPCDSCKFCCWSYSVEFPKELKSALSHCKYECKKGCSIHMKLEQPDACGEFHCPYQERDGLHRPDAFQETLESLGGDIGNYIPVVPTTISVKKANDLIRETRTVPAAVINSGKWVNVILPLDRNKDGGWVTGDPDPWNL